MRPLERELNALWPADRWLGTRVLVAVSGGADSVALLRAMVNLAGSHSVTVEGQIQAAHYNHGWRGAASDGDEEFVRELCQDLQVPLIVGCNSGDSAPTPERAGIDVDVNAAGDASRSSSGGGIYNSPVGLPEKLPNRTEAGARELRYDFLAEAAYRCAARYVLTAHTANDRVETMLHNLFRGTGLSGAVGPPLTRPFGAELVLVRPLLSCWREQVEAYLQELEQDFRQDASNADIAFQRNYLRHKLLPDLRERFGASLDQRLLDFSELAEEVVTDQRELAAQYLSQAALLRESAVARFELPSNPEEEVLSLPSLQKLACTWSVVRQALVRSWQERQWPLQSMSRPQWNKLRWLMSSPEAGERENLPGNLVAERVGEWIVITSAQSRCQRNITKL